MNELYPLKFEAQLKDKIWGGQGMKNLGYELGAMPNCGEAWLISGVEGSESIVAEGWLKGNSLPELMEIYMEELVGDSVYERYGEHFPLLLKILDANDWLSIQVHPNDQMAERKGYPNGKSELWYVMEAGKKAEIISGFTKDTSKEEVEKLLSEKRLNDILNRVEVEKGDVFFTPSGRLHALGPNIMLAEIQQSSDLTYRLYDFDRPGLDGSLRELHLQEALEALDYKQTSQAKTLYERQLNTTQALAQQDCFTTNIIRFSKPVTKDLSILDSFVIYLCTEGNLTLDAGESYTLRKGEVILVPACLSTIKLLPEKTAEVLEIYIR